jgi:transcriptional regulator with XRE-family HTH domain
VRDRVKKQLEGEAVLIVFAEFEVLRQNEQLLNLEQRSAGTPKRKVESSPAGTYLRFLRKRSGLSQRDVARILGCVSAFQVSRHEHSASSPSVEAAFGYQVLFQQSASEIFPGLYESIRSQVNEQILEIENELHQSSARGGAAALIAQRLEFICVHKDEKFAD